MASYPGSKVHRVSRRKLGRGQHVQVPAAHAVLSITASVLHVVFDTPVVVSGPIPAVSNGDQTIVSQAVVDSQHVNITFDATLVGATVTIEANPPTVATFQGGGMAAASGTF